MKIYKIQQGLRTKFDYSRVKFKKTFQHNLKRGIDLKNTTEYIKKDGFYYKLLFISGNYDRSLGGRYFEEVILVPVKQNRNN